MAAEAFGRACGFLDQRRLYLARWLCGSINGLLYVGWMLLLVLFVELLLSGSGVLSHQAIHEYKQLTGVTVHVDDAGMFSTVWRARDTWLGAPLDFCYRNLSWSRSNLSYLALLILVALILGASRTLLLLYYHHVVASAITAATTDLQHKVFHHKFAAATRAFQPGSANAMRQLLGEGIPALQQAMRAYLDVLPAAPIRLGLLILFVLLLNPWLGVAFLLMALLVYVLGVDVFRHAIERRSQLTAVAAAQRDQLVGLADKMRLIKGYAAEDYFKEQYKKHLVHYQDETNRRLREQGWMGAIWQFLGLLLILLVIGLGAQNVLTDKFGLASAVGVFAALLSLIMPISAMARLRREVTAADQAAEFLFTFLDDTDSTAQEEGRTFLSPLSKSLEFERLSYENAQGHLLINDVSIRLHARQRVALLGSNPEEVRVLIYLLNRFLDPTRGEIRIDGQDIRQGTLESLRSQIALVLQSDLVFPDTVANNIGCGDPSFQFERIVEAAKVAHAHHFVHRLPNGYSCTIGEGGFPLKHGENYRIALARAILRDPPLVVIEEPTTAMDEESKAMVEDTLGRFLVGRSAIIIPSRLATVRACDLILVLHQGKLAACGTHRELLESSELYRHLEYTRLASPLPFNT